MKPFTLTAVVVLALVALVHLFRLFAGWSKYITWHTRIRRLVRRTVYCSKTQRMHDVEFGLLINENELGGGRLTRHLQICNTFADRHGSVQPGVKGKRPEERDCPWPSGSGNSSSRYGGDSDV